MYISYESLIFASEETGFRPEMLEKVIYLIHLLNRFSTDDYLQNRFVLKGGTALNLFSFNFPRLSVDIDINYIGSGDRDIMLQEKEVMESAVEEIILDEKFSLQRKPSEHSGGKWSIRYPSSVRGQGIIEIDLNFLDRVPLWPITRESSFKLSQFQALNIPVQDIHELAAGKFRALFSRHSSRDLFDAHLLLTSNKIDIEKLRLGFIVYGASSRKDWRGIKIDDIKFNWVEFQNLLIPLLKKFDLQNRSVNAKLWAETILNECKTALTNFLPLRENEIEFYNQLLDHAEIKASLLTDDEALQGKIRSNPAIQWKAKNVREFKNL